MLKLPCRIIPVRTNAHPFVAMGSALLALALAFSVVASLPLGAFAEEGDATASDAPVVVDPSDEGGVLPQEKAQNSNDAVALNVTSASSSFETSYRAYQSGSGWTAFSDNAGVAGDWKDGAFEGVEFVLGGTASSYSLSGTYLVCGEDSFRNFSAADKCQIGTAGKGQCLDAFSINAPVASDGSQAFDIYYRVYLEHYGWLGWASNGQVVGSNDESLKILSVQIELVNKGETLSAGDISSGKETYIEISNLITYSAHVQGEGWMPSVREGSVAGTTGRGLRMEAVRLQLGSRAAQGSVEARGHVSGLGWQGWSEGGCGTEGRSLALEAVCLRLTGQAAETYDVWYRVHSAGIGWMGWAKNGEEAGSQGFGRAAEAVEVRLLPKGSAAPGDTSGAFVDCGVTYSAHVQGEGWMPSVREGSVAGTTGRGLRMEAVRLQLGSRAAQGSVEARGHVSGLGWQGWSEGGCGTEGRSLALEAVCLRLTGQAAETYDVWYRVHSAGIGWMGWAKNGEEAGSQGFGRAAEAVEVRLLPKGSAAPGDTSGAFVNKSGQDLKFKVTYRNSEVSPSSTSNGSYRYVLPSAASADQVSIAYVSGTYETLQLGSTGLTIAREGEVLASDAGATLKYASGDTISVRLGSVEVASLTLCRSSDIAALYITSDDPENYGRSYVEGSPDHSLSAAGSMTMLDSAGTVVYDGELTQIKGRGNTTWSCTKKPYQIKLSKKTDLLQSGSKENKNKTWVLLANAFDMTGLRNLTAYNIASAIGVKSAIESRPVDLFYDGEYRGTYQLCEKVQINTGRVDIYNLEDEIDELNEDISSLPRGRAQNKYGNTFQYTEGVVNPSDITGGYLVEYDPGRYKSESSWFMVDMRGKKVAFVCKSPEYWSYEQAKYLSEYFQEAFNAISSGGVNPETSKLSTDYFDSEAFASLYWMYEMTLGNDGFNYSSTYVYKDKDRADQSKLVFGPAWDFDNSLGNSEHSASSAFFSPNWWYTRQYADLGSFLYGDYHLKRAVDSYRGRAISTAREYLTGESYDSVADRISESLTLNDYLWGSNSETAETLKYWFLQRLNWIRSQF